MGFFSWNCECCGHPLLSGEATQDQNEWMNEGVALCENESILMGLYDGYGNLNNRDITDSPQVYHKACWILAGKPKDFVKASDNAIDQGWFFNDNTHNLPEPQNQRDLDLFRMIGKKNQEIHRNERKLSRLEFILDTVLKSTTEEELNKVKETISKHFEYKEEARIRDLATRFELNIETFKKIFKILTDKNKDFDFGGVEEINKIDESNYRLKLTLETKIDLNLDLCTVSDLYYWDEENQEKIEVES